MQNNDDPKEVEKNIKKVFKFVKKFKYNENCTN